MNKKMHARTMALVLATTTLLQVTGVTSQLLNGVPFEVANAAEIRRQEPLPITQSGFEVTTGAGVIATEGSVTIQGSVNVFEGGIAPSTIEAKLIFATDGEETIEAYADASVAYNNDGTATVTAATFNDFDLDYTISPTFSQDVPVITIPASTTPASVEIIADPGGLYALMKDEYGFDITSIPGAAYVWYKDNTELTTTSGAHYDVTDADEGSNFIVQATYNGVTTTSQAWYYEIPVDVNDLEEDIADANELYDAAVEGTAEGQYRSGSKEIFKRAIDVAQAVIDDMNCTQEDVDNAILALASAKNEFDLAKNGSTNPPVATVNYSVNILGTERVGSTLTAQLMKDNVEFTEAADITYEWYRIDDRHDAARTFGTLVGKNKTYSLVSSDLDKYIRVFVYYKGKQIAEKDTGSIDRRSSSSSSGSSSSNSSSSGSSGTDSSSNGSGTTSITGTGTTVTLTGDNNNGAMRLVDSNGQPVVGWQQINSTWYLANPAGIVQTGWQKVEGTWYLLNNNGAMATGWQQVNGTWYLLNSNGAMATGWQKVNDKWYYLYSDGSMASNTTINGYTVDASGAWV